MPTHIAETPLHGLTKLTPNEQTAVKAAIFDLQVQPDLPSFQLHRVQAPDDGMWSARVDLDVRLILHKRGDTTVVCYADHHDAAYAWAGRRRLDVHETTGAAQFVVIDERTEEVVKRVPRVVIDDDAPAPERPFARLDDAALLAYGVPREWIRRVRAATLDERLANDVDRLLDGMPNDRARVHAVHLHHWAVERWKTHHGAPPTVAKTPELQEILTQAATEIRPRDFTAAFVAAEWDGVIDPYGIHSWNEYADVDRVARATPLNRAQR